MGDSVVVRIFSGGGLLVGGESFIFLGNFGGVGIVVCG